MCPPRPVLALGWTQVHTRRDDSPCCAHAQHCMCTLHGAIQGERATMITSGLKDRPTATGDLAFCLLLERASRNKSLTNHALHPLQAMHRWQGIEYLPNLGPQPGRISCAPAGGVPGSGAYPLPRPAPPAHHKQQPVLQRSQPARDWHSELALCSATKENEKSLFTVLYNMSQHMCFSCPVHGAFTLVGCWAGNPLIQHFTMFQSQAKTRIVQEYHKTG